MTDRHPTDFDCQRVDELAGAIALGALDPEELAAVDAHLAGCEKPHPELRELLGAGTALAWTIEPRDPDPELRARVMASVGGGARAQEPARAARRANRRQWLDWSAVGLWRGIAIAASVVLLVGAVSWLGLRQQVTTQQAALSTIAEVIGQGAPAYPVTGAAGAGYVVDTSGPGATFLVAGLDPLTGSDQYEMWLIDAGGTPIAVGMINEADQDLAVAAVEQDLAGFVAFAVTVEPMRVEAPTSDPVMQGALTD
jgi:anti-sigma-K factor RskA